jgi:hypothetical protein
MRMLLLLIVSVLGACAIAEHRRVEALTLCSDRVTSVPGAVRTDDVPPELRQLAEQHHQRPPFWSEYWFKATDGSFAVCRSPGKGDCDGTFVATFTKNSAGAWVAPEYVRVDVCASSAPNQPLHPTTSGGPTAAVVAGERRR